MVLGRDFLCWSLLKDKVCGWQYLSFLILECLHGSVGWIVAGFCLGSKVGVHEGAVEVVPWPWAPVADKLASLHQQAPFLPSLGRIL